MNQARAVLPHHAFISPPASRSVGVDAEIDHVGCAVATAIVPSPARSTDLRTAMSLRTKVAAHLPPISRAVPLRLRALRWQLSAQLIGSSRWWELVAGVSCYTNVDGQRIRNRHSAGRDC
jgi:hypothetical protein